MILGRSKLIKNPVEGYDWKNYDKRYGIDGTLTDIPSQLVVEQAMNLILDGYSDATVYDALTNTYGMNSYSAKFIVRKAHDMLLKKEEKQEENMMQKQTYRLLKLYRECLEKGDRKIALSSLAELNKLHKLYTTKIEISSDVFTLDLGIGVDNNDSEEQTD